MKKNYRFTELSDTQCGCGRYLKKRVVENTPNATQCYQCSHPERKTNKLANGLDKELRVGI